MQSFSETADLSVREKHEQENVKTGSLHCFKPVLIRYYFPCGISPTFSPTSLSRTAEIVKTISITAVRPGNSSVRAISYESRRAEEL